MEATRRQQLTRQRPVVKASLTRMQTFIETGDRKVTEIQVRFDDLPGIFNRVQSFSSNGQSLHTSEEKLDLSPRPSRIPKSE
jgi:hypothetical protein